MIPVDPPVRRPAGDTNGGGRRTRDDASWLALTNTGSGRYVPVSENPPGQPVALECPQCPRGGVRPAAEFVRQFCLRRQPGPRRVFAAPDPPREHGVNVLVGPRVLPRIIHDQSHGQCNDPSPDGLLVFHLEHPRVAAPTDVYARVTPSPGRRQLRTFTSSTAMYKYTAVPTDHRGVAWIAVWRTRRGALDIRARTRRYGRWPRRLSGAVPNRTLCDPEVG
jgi:hypothetical protein